jgi:hypothetical protein
MLGGDEGWRKGGGSMSSWEMVKGKMLRSLVILRDCAGTIPKRGWTLRLSTGH